jgi:hypothetical protein
MAAGLGSNRPGILTSITYVIEFINSRWFYANSVLGEIDDLLQFRISVADELCPRASGRRAISTRRHHSAKCASVAPSAIPYRGLRAGRRGISHGPPQSAAAAVSVAANDREGACQ